MLARRFYHGLDERLSGQPDAIISALLVLMAIMGTVVALWGPRPLKAVILLFWVLP
jgi:hypothetical protein